jgi:hypothetical protein
MARARRYLDATRTGRLVSSAQPTAKMPMTIVLCGFARSAADAQPRKPNVLVIWGDDIGGTTSAPTTWA